MQNRAKMKLGAELPNVIELFSPSVYAYYPATRVGGMPKYCTLLTRLIARLW